ncbi:hypothetical protein RH915_02655 [Serpentinicella sp. ANB-PHB4]|uniref:hypothetical protein n=1 Tax=Serpentinicella sp. ANB-PHB4 TaxID=3074076 RepID=UPI00285F9373|nr:hypothetical protein [Serpentinicella sp. ANB-PHB4]MDR5658382.1 hypothetical protein [Serpentinicella sp. ANB-PHB4]
MKNKKFIYLVVALVFLPALLFYGFIGVTTVLVGILHIPALMLYLCLISLVKRIMQIFVSRIDGKEDPYLSTRIAWLVVSHFVVLLFYHYYQIESFIWIPIVSSTFLYSDFQKEWTAFKEKKSDKKPLWKAYKQSMSYSGLDFMVFIKLFFSTAFIFWGIRSIGHEHILFSGFLLIFGLWITVELYRDVVNLTEN